jgi:predicted signal transduction protein with EAL and GGDEF domain
VREGDVVARLGGDEFAVLQAGGADRENAQKLSERILRSMAEPYCALGQKVSCGASIGIALAPVHGTTAEDLLKSADVALYSAKSAGRGTIAFFESGRQHVDATRRQLESDLRAAVDGNQLELYYQPIVDFKKHAVAGFEALMRWHHPSFGTIAPEDFIPLAEETGLIVEMGAWAVQEACREAARWPSSIRVTVNLSAVQFERGDVYHVILSALQDSGLSPQRLELEITESVLLRDEARTHEVLHNLRALGVRIALDDFGTAYASLSYLRSFPFDKIKIDRSFVRDLDFAKRKDCLAIIQAVSGLAQQMQMSTVAEGIETVDHAETVVGAGCNELQGFYFSQPVPASEVQNALAQCMARFEGRT